MSRDGLLPKTFSKVNNKTNVPVTSTLVTGVLGALMTGIMDLKQLADLANIILIGTFMLVALSVIVFRKTHPELKRNFSVPLVPVLPMIAVICCLFLMTNLSATTWFYFVAWLALGTVVYFVYSRKHSTLQSSNYSGSSSKSKLKIIARLGNTLLK